MKSTKMSFAEKQMAAGPSGLKIGERFLLAFDDPDLSTTHQGRLQDLNHYCPVISGIKTTGYKVGLIRFGGRTS